MNGSENMNDIIFPDDIVAIVKSFLDVNDGDEATQDVILAIGAEILDISTDTMYGMVSKEDA